MIRRLIHRFLARTGVPMVLNTTLNENAIAVLTISELVAMDLMRSGRAEN